ncbi:DUF2380 domain-containing protein [Dongia deserti]|uniref:DUF2380 domain-containing protein n=1 Tax=Dongia deserti TaxID=2268030 RepID=UPI000E653780|nr:DUF2380 domain-containing protein [Dongia deserti]
MKRVRGALRWLSTLAISCGCIGLALRAAVAEPVALAVADFDYSDTSGEVRDQSAEHTARLEDFTSLIRDMLSASGNYKVVDLVCSKPSCSASAMDAESLTEAARQSGARLLVYGGIHKMSTLVQFGKAQVVDLKTDTVVFDRTISFRGDNAEAWTRAGQFLAEDLLSKDLALQ